MRRLLSFLGCAVIAALATDARAQQVRLVADLDPSIADDKGSDPDEAVRLGSLVLFAATSPQYGREPWVSDGTPAGTRLLKDCWPGKDPGLMTGFAVLNGRGYFFAEDGVHGRELWVTDGTPAGTQLLLDLVPGWQSYFPDSIHAGGGKLFIILKEQGIAPYHLYVSDGTAAGTLKLSGVTGSAMEEVASMPARGTSKGFWFYAIPQQSSFGPEPFFSDGTVGGTRVLGDFTHPVHIRHSTGFFPVDNGRVVFAARPNPGTSASEHYVSDGTPNGTYRLDGNAVADDPVQIGEQYFDGKLLWATGAVAGGTKDAVLVSDLTPNSLQRLVDPQYGPRRGWSFFPFQNETWFRSYDASTGWEFWRSDGTAQGTRLALDFVPGAASSDPVKCVPMTGGFLFARNEAPEGLWFSDGTVAGTHVVLDATNAFVSIETPISLGARVFFVSSRIAWFPLSMEGEEPWTSDGTAQGTVRLANINPEQKHASSAPQQWLQTGGQGFFTAMTATAGRELYRTDGSTAGTILLGDLVPGSDSSKPELLASYGGKIWFGAETLQHGRELWASDGSAIGTRLVADIQPGAASSDPRHVVGLRDAVYFVATDPSAGREVHVTDGTAAGTRVLLDLTPGAGSTNIGFLAVARDRLFVLEHGSQAVPSRLYVSDGNAAGTTSIALAPRTEAIAAQFAVYENRVVFYAQDAQGRPSTWISDGTVAGTQVLANHGGRVSYQVVGRKLFWIDTPAIARDELWVSDGSVAGTQQLRNISGSMGFVGAFGDLLIYTEGSNELWRSDGTSAGSFRLLDYGNGPARGVALGSRLYAVGYEKRTTKHLILTDGSVTGTQSYTLFTGWDGPELLGMAAGSLYLSGWGPGKELHVLQGVGAGQNDAGAASGPLMPWLEMDDPVLGSTCRFSCARAPANSACALLLGGIEAQPGYFFGGWLQVDFALPVYIDAFVVQGSGWQRSLAIPNDVGLSGVRFAVQAWHFEAASFATQVTQGIHARVGL